MSEFGKGWTCECVWSEWASVSEKELWLDQCWGQTMEKQREVCRIPWLEGSVDVVGKG